MIVVGVDPGGRNTGLVARDHDDLLGHAVLGRRAGDDIATWAREVVEQTRSFVALIESTSFGGRPPASAQLIAVEDLVPPNPHLGLASVRGIIDTAFVLGALLQQFPAAVLVRPAGHGSWPLRAYPPELRGSRERVGSGILRHARSAWDIAGAATSRTGF